MAEHHGPEQNAQQRARAAEIHAAAAQRARESAARAAERARESAERAAERGGGFPGKVLEEQAVRADFRAVVGVAMLEATNRASASIEAEHLLLAFLFDRRSAATERVAAFGLSYETFSDALRQEREQTLAAIGIRIPDAARLRAAPRVRLGGPRFGASAKETWERTMRRARTRRGRAQRPTPVDFLISLLSLELGTVPRALVIAGVDREAAIRALEELSSPTRTTTTKEPE